MKKFKYLPLLMTAILLTACGQEQVMDGDGMFQIDPDESEVQETDIEEQPEAPVVDADNADNGIVVSAGGPYGRITVTLPDGWIYEEAPVDSEKMIYGLYGIILKPENVSEGQMELFCTDSFGVCGTGLESKEITLAGNTVSVGTYDDHEHWDFIVMKNDKPEIVVQHTDCSSWTDTMWDEALSILDTMSFDESLSEGGVGQYIPESENDTIAVMMSVTNVTPTGLTVHLRQYDKRETGELIYGEGYHLERLDGDMWEDVPAVIDNGAFNDVGYTIPSEGEAVMATDWEWLYGSLAPGTYRITKSVTDSNRSNPDVNIPAYPLTAQFIIAGPDGVKETYEVTDADLSKEYFEEDKLVILVRYYEMNDGTWRTDEHTYKYRLEITGRMGGAVKDSTFVYLSNIEDISFERAYMAAGLSSNMNDYFKPEEAVLVAMK